METVQATLCDEEEEEGFILDHRESGFSLGTFL